MSTSCAARTFVLVSMLLATGCASELEPPQLRSIVPATVVEGRSTEVLIDADIAFPWSADYSAATAEIDTSFTVTIGGLALRAPGLTAEGDVHGQLPFGLAPGRHDVWLTLGDGRTAVLTEGFEVTPGVFPTGYTIDPIGTQVRQRPFTITVRAQGPGADTFNGSVELLVSRGAITPDVSAPFRNGVLTQEVVLTAPTDDAVITVRDSQGNEARSNVFVVNN